MSQTENSEEFHMDPQDVADLKRDLLATVFSETHSRLVLLQKGLGRRAAKNNLCKKLTKTSRSFKEPMPCEEVLEDIKLDQELDAIRNIFKIAFETVTTDKYNQANPYVELINAIQRQHHTSNEAEILSNELEQNRSVLKQLEAEQIKQDKEIAEQLAQKKQRVVELREQLKRTQRINRLEVKLVEKWEANRLVQATIVGEREERSLTQQILDVNRQIAGEQRLINEVLAFRNNEISELRVKIQEWEEKFKTEKATKTAENLRLSQNIADVIKTHEKHQEIMAQREMFVAEYLQQKAEEQRLYEAQCHRIKCAVSIQAWWRGVMVRQSLGPYRKKSKKSKKSKGKK